MALHKADTHELFISGDDNLNDAIIIVVRPRGFEAQIGSLPLRVSMPYLQLLKDSYVQIRFHK